MGLEGAGLGIDRHQRRRAQALDEGWEVVGIVDDGDLELGAVVEGEPVGGGSGEGGGGGRAGGRLGGVFRVSLSPFATLRVNSTKGPFLRVCPLPRSLP
jgi:hypothetical protein